MTDDELDGRLTRGTRDLARAESDRRPQLPTIERRARHRRHRSTIPRSTVALAGFAIVIGVIVSTRSSGPERVITSGPSTSAAETTTVPPTRVIPWISTEVEPDTRDTFAHTLDATGVHNAALCTLNDLFVTAIFGGAGGMESAGIKVRNQTTHACTVQGSPYVRFLDTAGRDVGEYTPARVATDAPIVLLPTSWAAVGFTPIGSDHCGGPNNDSYFGTTAAAIAFGIDPTATRVVHATGDQPRPNGCPPAIPPGNHTGSFEPIPLSSTSVIVLGPLHDGVVLNAPQQIRRGETASYSITLTNTSLNSLALVADDCPLYQESLGRTASSTLLLNCGGSPGMLIAPGTSVQFDMRLAVPADQPLGPTTLRWQSVEPQEPALSAQVTVVDNTTTATP
jgi:hypothetical protein